MTHRVLVAWAAFAFAVGCGKSGGGGGSNTSWEVCTSDRDCITGETCVDRRCVAASDASPRSGAGGSGGMSGGSGGEVTDAAAADAPIRDAGSENLSPSDAAVNVDAGPPLAVTEVVLGERHTCVLLSNGSVKCWGGNYVGQLGYGNTNAIGDDELPSSVGFVNVVPESSGLKVKSLAAGRVHTCALLTDGTVKCWGDNTVGQLGYGNTNAIGDDELPSSVGVVSVTTIPGVTATAITAGWSHTCALLTNGTVTCWGQFGDKGGVGYGNTNAIGDDEVPSSVGPVPVTDASGVTVTGIFGGAFHTCARLSTGNITCFGRGSFGELGYGNLDSIGDDELPSWAGPVSVTSLAFTVESGSGGNSDTCVRLSDGTAKCWGSGGTFFPSIGLGYGSPDTLGDDEIPSSYGPLSLTTVSGVTVKALAGGFAHRYALLSDGSVVTWGSDDHGQLGHANTDVIGDDELPSATSPVVVTREPGVTVTALGTGNTNYHSCVVLSNGTVKCWGYGEDGELGTAHKDDVGDDEVPSAIGPVVLF